MLADCLAACLALAPATEPVQVEQTAAEIQQFERQELPEDAPIIVYGRQLRRIGIARSASEGVVGYADFEGRPIARVGELVENVPGVIATQHSGTGKANQYFLRGFNLDHGTDFAGFVDGVPVNLRSHGHGQGYLDLNFLIPELVERIDYRKGPYFADVGDFSAAGTARFTTHDRLRRPFAEVTIGEFGYVRALAAGSYRLGSGDLLAGIEGVLSNGPWQLDEDLEKANALVKYSAGDWSLALSGYRARWASTDQVPARAVASGQIDRLGFIDPDLGGATSRIALTGQGRAGGIALGAYAVRSRLRLTSNFTYFLDDPEQGDEFQQRDRRWLFGGWAVHERSTRLGAMPVVLRIGADARYDAIGQVGLYRSAGGARTAIVREDAVDEYSAGLYADASFTLAPRLRATLGLRGDVYGYDVAAGLAANSGDGSKAFLAPKAGLAWIAAPGFELYANYGESFHSNDVRGATIAIDPATGDPAERVGVFARARGGELGGRIERGRLTASVTAWHLRLASELVFVGDAGSTEPNPASRRSGLEVTAFWRPFDWLTLDTSAAVTKARFRGVPAGENRIPGAVARVVAAGAAADLGRGLSGALRVRHFGPAPLIENGAVRSDATTVVNLGTYYEVGRLKLGLDVLNLLDAEDADITYFYASRLTDEPTEGIEDLHLHPVEPRQLRVSARLSF